MSHKLLRAGFAGVAVIILLPSSALAHRSGCHNLHTCPSDTKSYVCGDLGYPCNGATSIDDISLSAINVPLAAEAAFKETFGRGPTEVESSYWKKRFRADKSSVHKLRRVMAWHKANGSSGPPALKVSLNQSRVELAAKINALFRSVHDGRNPTISENLYWLSRLTDKPSEAVLRDAIAWHKANRLQH